jgi:hypothetical protein
MTWQEVIAAELLCRVRAQAYLNDALLWKYDFEISRILVMNTSEY